MDGHNQLFFNEYFLQHSFINQVKLSKNVRKWRDFYNHYCNAQINWNSACVSTQTEL